MHSSENDAVLISLCEPINHIHQDTKSARLIAVCKVALTKITFSYIIFSLIPKQLKHLKKNLVKTPILNLNVPLATA